MRYTANLLVVAVTIGLLITACDLGERLGSPEEEPLPGTGTNVLSLTKSGVTLAGETQIYAGFTSPRDTWLDLNPAGYSVTVLEGTYCGLRSGHGFADSMLTSGIEVETAKGMYPLTCYNTSVDGAFFRFTPMPDSTIYLDCNNLNDVRWVEFATDSTSISTLDNWAETDGEVRLPMVKGSIARCWVNGVSPENVHASSWTSRTNGAEISELHLQYLVPSPGDGWIFEVGMDENGVLYNPGTSNITIIIHP